MFKRKWHCLCLDRFPVNLTFTMLCHDFPQKKCSFDFRHHVSASARKMIPVMEKSKQEKKASDRNWEIQKRTDRHSLHGKHSAVCSLIDTCFSLPGLDMVQANILPTRYLSNKTCLHINTTGCLLFHYHSTETTVSRNNWNSCCCFWFEQ